MPAGISNMRVLFRADASLQIGTGHVVRCATLAETLRSQGAEVVFACRALPGNLLAWLEEKGFATIHLTGDQVDTLTNPSISDTATELIAATQSWTTDGQKWDWLIVDHYGLDARWESLLRTQCRHILVLDDLFNRPHDCDLLLDQNLLNSESPRYQALVPETCRQILGPQFALLRPEFVNARAQVLEPATQRRKPTDTAMPKLFIFFGGSDPTQECFKALDALQWLPPDCPVQIDLVAGRSNPHFEDLQARCAALQTASLQIHLHRQVNAMAELMARASLGIGAGGTATWERFCVGLPSIIIAVADNQVEISQNLARDGYQVYLGESQQVSADRLSEAIVALLRQPEKREVFSAKTMDLVDGMGVHRVVEHMRLVAETTITP